MLLVNPDCLSKKDAEVLKAQIEQQAKERRMLEADYEARLKADMVAMLTEIQIEIEEKATEICDDGWWLTYNYLIQQKINALKEKKDQ